MNNLIKIGLGLSIAIVYPFMIAFGIESFYPQPKQAYEVCQYAPSPAYLPDKSIPQQINSQQNDVSYKKCFDKAQEQNDIYNRNVFLITTIFSFFAIAVGTLLFNEKMGPVGPGLVFGGLFTIMYGTGRSFRSLDKRWIFVELVAVFIGLILVTWRYIKVNKK